MPNRAAATHSALVALLVLSACEDSSTGSAPSPVGDYALTLWGESELPILLEDETTVETELHLEAGAFVVLQNGSCEQSFVITRTFLDGTTPPEDVSRTHACEWSRTGNTLVMERSDGLRATAQIEADRLLMDPPNDPTLTYERP